MLSDFTKSAHRGTIIRLGTLALLLLTASVTREEVPNKLVDERSDKLRAFFESYECPQPLHVDEYLHAADRHSLDYRLLPAISVRESTCGMHAQRNNYWGWASGKRAFPTVKAGIEYISGQLHAYPYRDKSVTGKLHAYNPRAEYVASIKRLMQEIE